MTPAVPNVEVGELSDEHFKLRKSQKVGFGVLGLLVLALGVMMIQNEEKTVDGMTVIVDSVGITSNLLVVQSESLQFAAAYERLLNGATTGVLLKIRRAELAVPLAQFENHSATYNRLINSEYLNALGVLDSFLVALPPGPLAPVERIVLRAKISAALKTFSYESKTFAVFGSRGVDERTRQHIRDENTRRRNQYFVLLAVLTLVIAVNIALVFSRIRDFRRIKIQMNNERRKLEQSTVALQQADLASELRLEKERIERAENQWVDATTRSISLQFKSTVIPERVAELVGEGLGRALGADTVVGLALGEMHVSGFLTQWNPERQIKFEESYVLQYGSNLLALANRLWSDKRVVTVNDSRLIDVSHDPVPEFAAAAQQRLRSWVIAPVGHGPQVLGLLFVAMEEDVRIWSAAEIELIQNIASESANVYINLRMFGQTVEIAESNAMVGHLAELDRAKNDFIENMNHELRSPLTSIIGYVDMMIGDIDPAVEPELLASLTTVQRNALRLQNLIVNTTQISKSDVENVSLVISKVDIGHLLGDAVKSMELGADVGGVGLTLRLDSPSDDLLIDGDINRLQQVFVNLLSNAIKYTPLGGMVTVGARRAGAENEGDGCVEVTVKDTGIGISPEEFPSMFKRFFRASTATQAAIPGFGIGLSLVHSIVTEHHGTITFDSVVGKGTVFTVRLPVQFVSTEG